MAFSIMSMKTKSRNSIKYSIALLLVTVGIIQLFKYFPALSEQVYGRFLFPIIAGLQSIFNNVFSFFTFSMSPSLVGLIILILAFFSILYLWLLKQLKFMEFLRKILLSTVLLICVFYWFWGMNYFRPSLKEHLGLTIETPNNEYIFTDFEQLVGQLNYVRGQINIQDTIPWYDEKAVLVDYDHIQRNVQAFLQQASYKTNYRAKATILKPKGILLRTSTSGVYNPFFGEPIIDSGLPLISRPHTVAHEISHAYGVTGEGECNFVALQACKESSDALVKYSGLLHYYRYAAAVAFQADSIQFRNMNNRVDSLIINDLNSRRRCANQFPDILPEVRDVVYDQYLKSNGVEDGIKNYSQVYLLEYAWKKKQGK